MASTMKIADAKISAPRAAPQTNRSRRTYAQRFKQDVVTQCLVPGASVSAIALSHGINANVIRKWLPRREPETGAALATMLPVTIEPVAPVVTRKAPMQVTRGAARPAIELSLAGATVRLPAGFDPAELRSIVQILATLR